MANPGHTHWEAVKHVIRYLKGTKDAKLTLGKGSTLTWEELNCCYSLSKCIYSDAEEAEQEL